MRNRSVENQRVFTSISTLGLRRASCLAMVAVTMLLITGCGPERESAIRSPELIARDVAPIPPNLRVDAPVGSAMLFDAQPGPYAAGDFTFRSDWPSTVSHYSTGQVFFYRERYYGHEGRNQGRSNPTYRRVDTTVYSAGVRP